MKSRTAIIVVMWVVALPFIAWGTLELFFTLVVSMIGGPIEGPSNMSWDEFMRWVDSGQWWRDSVREGSLLVIIPLVVAGLVTLAAIRRTGRVPPKIV